MYKYIYVCLSFKNFIIIFFVGLQFCDLFEIAKITKIKYNKVACYCDFHILLIVMVYCTTVNSLSAS